MSTHSFHNAMAELHLRLGLDASKADAKRHNLYVISVGSLEIEMVGTQEGYINLLCFPGDLPSLTPDRMSVLLAANRYHEEHPVITASLLDSGPRPRVTLWSRITLVEADSDTLGQLFLRFSELAHATKTWIEAGAPAINGDKLQAGKSSATADRLQILRKASPPNSTL